MEVQFDKIKLVIWDLDDTFWRGTLSEGGVEEIASNVALVKRLTDIGIVNSICSKNDEEPTVERLKEIGIEEYFVFKSIDWTPKGQRIQKIITDMGLRDVNVLFLDDNPVNLNEAAHYNPGLMIAEPQIIEALTRWAQEQTPADLSHKRLKQYKVLEEKMRSKGEFSNNLDFLYSTKTVVKIHRDCSKEFERIYELIHRTNQLNYTKKRISKEELETILNDSSYDCGYVTVKDRFGDYGIVGFFAVKEGRAEHLLFSCRAIGQGVEQWVYSTLGCPELKVEGAVITQLVKGPAPKWINMEDAQESGQDGKNEAVGAEGMRPIKILFKGACDLAIVTSYMIFKGEVIEEFTYLGQLRKNEVEHHNHSVNYLALPFLSDEQKQTLVDECIFNDPAIFSTHLYDNDLDMIVLSTLSETNLGVYKKRGTDIKIAFGEWTGDLTNPEVWDKLISGEQYPYMNKFTKEYLQEFAQKYEFLGPITPQEYIQNLEQLLVKTSPKAHICLILGSEIQYEKESLPVYFHRAEEHKRLNAAVRKFAENNPRISLLEITPFIEGQHSFSNNINHFERSIYFKMSQRLNQIIAEHTGLKFSQVNPIKRYLKKLGAKYTTKINRNAWYYPMVAKLFHKLADK